MRPKRKREILCCMINANTGLSWRFECSRYLIELICDLVFVAFFHLLLFLPSMCFFLSRSRAPSQTIWRLTTNSNNDSNADNNDSGSFFCVFCLVSIKPDVTKSNHCLLCLIFFSFYHFFFRSLRRQQLFWLNVCWNEWLSDSVDSNRSAFDDFLCVLGEFLRVILLCSEFLVDFDFDKHWITAILQMLCLESALMPFSHAKFHHGPHF